jgi:hypothetical protein
MSDPMEEGRLAASNGQPRSANAHPPESEEFEEWLVGWNHFHEVDEEGEPLSDP